MAEEGSCSIRRVRSGDALAVTDRPLDQLDAIAVGIDDPRRSKVV
jgi:hypothetical protein